jgi:hypothetical protein
MFPVNDFLHQVVEGTVLIMSFSTNNPKINMMFMKNRGERNCHLNIPPLKNGAI